MTKAARMLLLTVVAASGASAVHGQTPPASKSIAGAIEDAAAGALPKCSNDDPNAVVVCGRSQKLYRIDPLVLATTRAAEAPPPKPPIDATTAEQCTGPDCGGGSYVPLVAVALTAVKAAELAAQGDDWRDAFRTRPDQYRVYQQEQAKQAKSRGISIGVMVGNARP